MMRNNTHYHSRIQENIDEEFKRLAVTNIGQELANLALDTLYPSLNEKNKREVKEIIIENFEKFKEEHKK